MIRLTITFIALCLAVGCYRQPQVMTNVSVGSYLASAKNTSVDETRSDPQDVVAINATVDLLADARPASGTAVSAEASHNTTAQPTAQPTAVLEDNVFHFGTMEPFERRKHTFVIRNEGDAPLEISEGHSSCKCTLGEVGDGVIPPGGESTVTLSWRSGEGNKIFAHEAEVLTNDPDNPVLICRVEGQIVSRLITDPNEFSLPGVAPGEAAQSTVTVMSEVWESFELCDISSSMEGLTWEVQRLFADEKASLNARDGYRITVTIPVELAKGYFSSWLRMQIQPNGEAARQLELPIKGNVLRRVAIYGNGIDSTGTIKLGKIRKGMGLKKYFNVKVRDPEPELKIKELEITPEYLVVSFLDNEKVQSPGLYRMLVEVPASAPRAVFMGNLGKLHVEFENPRLEHIDLNVEFAILGEHDF